ATTPSFSTITSANVSTMCVAVGGWESFARDRNLAMGIGSRYARLADLSKAVLPVSVLRYKMSSRVRYPGHGCSESFLALLAVAANLSVNSRVPKRDSTSAQDGSLFRLASSSMNLLVRQR